MKRLSRILLILGAFALFATACGAADEVVDTATEAAGDAADAVGETTDAVSDAAGDAAGAVEEAMEDDAEPEEAMEEEAMEEEAEPEEAMEEAMEEVAGSDNVGLVYDIGGRGDQSFNDSAAAGLERAEADLGNPFTEVSPNDDGSNRAELLQLQADNSGIVIGVGFLFADSVAEVAANNPDVNFAVVDDGMLNFETDPPSPRGDNIAGMTFAEEQGSFLVGVAAALKSETGKIGFIGGVCCFGLIEKFEAGYVAGAKSVNPDIEIVSQYITEFPDFDGFTSPDRAKETSLAMFDAGADIVYHAAGGSGAGLFEAAKEHSEANGSKVWGIGVDSDQYNTVSPEVQEYVLTSMLKRVDNSVFEIINTHNSGDFAAGNTVYDLSTGGVDYSTSGGYLDDIVPELENFKAQIIAGDIEVPTAP